MQRVLAKALLVLGLLQLTSLSFAAQATFTPLSFARERSGPRYTVPASQGQIAYQQSVYRSANNNFILRVTLSAGARFTSLGVPPALAYANNAGGAVTVSPLVTGGSGLDHVEWLVLVTSGFTEQGFGPPRFWIDLRGSTIDCGEVLEEGGSVTATVSVRNASTGMGFEPDVSVLFAFGAWGAWADGVVTPTTAQIYLGNDRKTFLPSGSDSELFDKGAVLPPLVIGRTLYDAGGGPVWLTVFSPEGSAFALSSDDAFELTFSSDLSGISRIHLSGWTLELSDADRASGEVTFSIPGNLIQTWAPIPGEPNLAFEVSGVSPLRARILTVSTSLYLGSEDTAFIIQDFTRVTEWYHWGSISTPQLVLSEVRFAKEAIGPSYLLPGCVMGFKQSVYRPSGLDFNVRLLLRDGARFLPSSPGTPQLYYLHSAQSANGGGEVDILPLLTTAAGLSYVEWRVHVKRGFTDTGSGPPLWSISFPGVRVDAGNVLHDGGSIRATVQTRDASTGMFLEMDATREWLKGVPGVSAGAAGTSSTAIVDLSNEGRVFQINAEDTATTDKGGFVGPVWVGRMQDGVNTVYGTDGLPFRLSESDQVQFTFSSRLNQITRIVVGGISRDLTDTDRASRAVTVVVPGSVINDWAGREMPVWFEVNGDERIETRVITAGIRLQTGTGHSSDLLASATVTRWSVDGSILTAAWANGNEAVLTSDLHLINLSGHDAVIKARVLSLPRLGGVSRELGRLNLGTIAAHGTLSANVAEIILQALGLSPYIPDDGDLAIELTAPGVKLRGVAVVWSPAFSFGACPLGSGAMSVLE